MTLADLQRMHLHHLRHGAAGIAADIETCAGLRGVTAGAVVAAIDDAARSEDRELAGWAVLVAAYARAAIAAGELSV